MSFLQVVIGADPGRKYLLDADRLIIGRHPDCDVVIDSAAVSRQHAQIRHLEGAFVVEDLDSRNGTFVNGQLVEGRRPLSDGDRLRICDLSLQFCDDVRRPRKGLPPMLDNPTPALLVDDEPGTRSSTITSKLDVSSSQSGVRLEVRPEVKLKAVLEIMHNLARTLAMDEVLPRLLDSLFKIFIQADRGFVVLRGPDESLQIKAEKHRRLGGDQRSRISRTIVHQVMTTKRAILSADAASDERFDMSQSIVEFRIRSMMCAPIVGSDGEALGVIQIDTLDQRTRFTDEDLEVLANVALQAAVAIENASLHEEKLRQQQVMRDLDLAHRVQQNMLPTVPPSVAGYHFFDFYRSAREVGGDYYNYVPLPDGRLAVVVADVSGKGIAAALLMARLSSEVGFCLAIEPTPAQAMCRLNTSFARGGWGDR
ncbi:MAG: FHA domain-containing protein, partial [Pirellulales bacterium]